MRHPVTLIAVLAMTGASAQVPQGAASPIAVQIVKPLPPGKLGELRVMTADGVCSIEITSDKLALCKETGITYSGKIIACDDLSDTARRSCEAANETARRRATDKAPSGTTPKK